MLNVVVQLLTLNRIIGLYGADTIGYIETILKLNNKFETIDNEQYVRIDGR
jgi:hypothetical protein